MRISIQKCFTSNILQYKKTDNVVHYNNHQGHHRNIPAEWIRCLFFDLLLLLIIQTANRTKNASHHILYTFTMPLIFFWFLLFSRSFVRRYLIICLLFIYILLLFIVLYLLFLYWFFFHCYNDYYFSIVMI